MTIWTDVRERPEYVLPAYMLPGYVDITYLIADGSGTSWSNATEANDTWTSAE